MADQVPSEPSPTDLHGALHRVAELLRTSSQLDPEAQQALAELVDDLSQRVQAAPASAPEIHHLAESTSHLLQALEHPHDRDVLASARDRLEQAVANAEAQAPFMAGIAQRLLEALANVGI